MVWAILALLVTLLILGGWSIGICYRLSRLCRQVKNSWDQMDAQLKKRDDLRQIIEEKSTMERLEELACTENKVAFLCQSYNDTVMLYNMRQQAFPGVIFAKKLGHKEVEQCAVR